MTDEAIPSRTGQSWPSIELMDRFAKWALKQTPDHIEAIMSDQPATMRSAAHWCDEIGDFVDQNSVYEDGETILYNTPGLLNLIRRIQQDAFQSKSPQATLDGWHLVPKTPTREMELRAARLVSDDLEQGIITSYAEVYRIMLAAAPSANECRADSKQY